jgi:hypothetical protein
MNAVIVEDPSKQPPRHRNTTHVLSTEGATQDGPTVSQQQERILNQKHGDLDHNVMSSGGTSGTSYKGSYHFFTIPTTHQNSTHHLRTSMTIDGFAATVTLKTLLVVAWLP